MTHSPTFHIPHKPEKGQYSFSAESPEWAIIGSTLRGFSIVHTKH